MTQPAATTIQRVAVIGGGVMGAGIAELCARRGLPVVLIEADHAAAERVEARVQAALARRPDDAARGRLAFAAAIDAVTGVDVVIEAIPEILTAKKALLRQVEELLPEAALIATNTSTIPITEIAAGLRRADLVVGLHFANPVVANPNVEVIAGAETASSTTLAAVTFARDALGKTPFVVPDRPGFVANAIVFPMLLAAVRQVELGGVSAAEVDEVLCAACDLRQGPLRTLDAIGLDTALFIAESIRDGLGDPACAPPPLLRSLVERGDLGRKSGRGFFEYRAGQADTA